LIIRQALCAGLISFDSGTRVDVIMRFARSPETEWQYNSSAR